MKINVRQATPVQLDWLVDKWIHTHTPYHPWGSNPPAYSSDWALAGPLIEQNLIIVSPDPSFSWVARGYMDANGYAGHTALVAAMRCYVAAMMSDEVDVPEELT